MNLGSCFVSGDNISFPPDWLDLKKKKKGGHDERFTIVVQRKVIWLHTITTCQSLIPAISLLGRSQSYYLRRHDR